MNILIILAINVLAVILAAYILPGVTVDGFFAALITALVIGFVMTVVKPLLALLTLPLNMVTLGLFTFVLNAILILLVSAVVPGFQVDNFGWALLFSLVLALVNAFLGDTLENRTRGVLSRT